MILKAFKEQPLQTIVDLLWCFKQDVRRVYRDIMYFIFRIPLPWPRPTHSREIWGRRRLSASRVVKDVWFSLSWHDSGRNDSGWGYHGSVLLMGDYQLTDKQIKFFISEVQRWCKFFSINDWEVMVDDNAEDGTYGQCLGDTPSRLSVISVRGDWDVEPSNKRLSRTAFHEVCELMLIDLSTLAEDRFVTRRQLETERHRVIRKLENVVWKSKG